MDEEAASQASASPAGEAPLKFHADFGKARPGDLLLQAGDRIALCFYFPHSLLSALSSFFATLPSPSPADMVNGYPLVPLHNTTSAGLHLFLLVLKSTNLSEDLAIPAEGRNRAVLDAACVARLYDAPLVPRVLVDTLKNVRVFFGPDRDYYLEFAVWAICDVRHRLEDAAINTTQPHAPHIAMTDPYIVAVCTSHAPRHWLQLQNFHLRRSIVVDLFTRKVLQDGALYRPGPSDGQCEEGHNLKKTMDGVCKWLLEQGTLRELGLGDEDSDLGAYGLGCDDCLDQADRCFGETLHGARDFIRYIRESNSPY